MPPSGWQWPRSPSGYLEHSWPAQVQVDLEAHLLLFVIWLLHRERTSTRGLLFALLTLLLGALFTLPYVVAAALSRKGDMAALLLGPGMAPPRGRD